MRALLLRLAVVAFQAFAHEFLVLFAAQPLGLVRTGGELVLLRLLVGFLRERGRREKDDGGARAECAFRLHAAPPSSGWWGGHQTRWARKRRAEIAIE